jgi:hypothetical protein
LKFSSGLSAIGRRLLTIVAIVVFIVIAFAFLDFIRVDPPTGWECHTKILLEVTVHPCDHFPTNFAPR